MTLIPIESSMPVHQADAARVDRSGLERELSAAVSGEVRFDAVSRALYSNDASVYQIQPLGLVVPRTREDLLRTIEICGRYECPMTMRGGGTSQAGQAIGSGVVVDTSKYLNRLLEVNPEGRWARVEPGIVLDDLNALLKPHNLRFAPDISTASRATVGGMIANNSAGARSVLYGKTIDHVLGLTVALSDGSVHELGPLDREQLESACARRDLAGDCYRVTRRLGAECAGEIERRYPKVLRRVGGYNLDEFTDPGTPFELAKLIVGSEGTLAVVLEARIRLVPLPRHKSVLTIQFDHLLDALGATPAILRHKPSAVEVMDGFILSNTRQSPALERMRQTFIQGEPGALLCVEFYADEAAELPERMAALEQDLRGSGQGTYFFHAIDPAQQARVWSLREAALGLSMAMREDAKSLSFVEDTAVSPEVLRDYIERFLAIIHRHGTVAGVYAHASVGCLHVRPVVNLKTGEGVAKFESIAREVAALVLEFGGALSGEHGDGLVRSPFMRQMFGPAIYEAFRTLKRTFDPKGILNPGKIVDPPPLTSQLRFGAGYETPNPQTWFDYSEFGGMGGAVEMCSGLGACRKQRDGTMCPSYMATREEKDVTRGRANVLRLAMSGRLGGSGLTDPGVYEVLDLCLECRACRSECPVGVDVARFKSEFLAAYWKRHGTPLAVRALANVHRIAPLASIFSSLSNAASPWTRSMLGVHPQRSLPRWAKKTFAAIHPCRTGDVQIFNDTFTNYFQPEIGLAAVAVLRAGGVRAGLSDHVCCGRPLISKGLLAAARKQASRVVKHLHPAAVSGQPIVFLEPSCLSAVKEDLPALLRGEEQARARQVAAQCRLFEEFASTLELPLEPGSKRILLHGHCHQKAMGLLPSAMALFSRIPGAAVTDLDAGCCGMAGSFGYAREHFELSRTIAGRKLIPAALGLKADEVLAASGTSCRHQVRDFAGVQALHAAQVLQMHLRSSG